MILNQNRFHSRVINMLKLILHFTSKCKYVNKLSLHFKTNQCYKKRRNNMNTQLSRESRSDTTMLLIKILINLLSTNQKIKEH